MQELGKYELREKLGEGTTAEVFLGFDRFARREVAVKLFYPEVLRDPVCGRMYQHLLMNEASLAGKLQHPHIVQIFDAVVSEEQGYLVMEYVPGGTLERHTRADNLLPIERVVEIVFKCTRALEYAARHGVTHRDIKPANLMLAGGAPDPSADIKITDFGAALVAASDRTQVASVGSPAYMSPQQVRELPLDHRTDIYSLGVVLYQLLTGRLPFEGSNNFSMIYHICNTLPPPPSSLRPEIPASLDAIAARAMHKDLDRRYGDWQAFAHDLAQAFRNRQLTVRAGTIGDSEKFETLRALPFFRDFSDVETWEVVRLSQWDQIAPGTVVMREGEPGDHFCFVAAGELRVEKRGLRLSTLGVGECFGEMAVIDREQGYRNADVVSETEARIITIRGDALRHATEGCRMHCYQAFLGVLARRLAAANARLASV
jgi:serine/threonine protein kinase